MDDKNNNYWSEYYVREDAPEIPSQFAVFVANELPNLKSILEIGCGNGRDALFFLQTGRRVVALDASDKAIETCRRRLTAIGGNADERVRFSQGRADDPAVWPMLDRELQNGPTLI